MEQDHVDRVLAQWARERPTLDVSPMAVISRICRAARIIEKSLDTLFAQHGLTREGFDVLATLLRSGPPHRLTPTRLFQMLMVSSGTMTNRLDRLEQAGHIQRTPDPDDRRGTLIQLTPQGMSAVSDTLTAHVENERALLRGLSPEDETALAPLLRKLLIPLEQGETS